MDAEQKRKEFAQEREEQSKLYSTNAKPMLVHRTVLARALREMAKRVMCDQALGALEVHVTKVGEDHFAGVCRIASKIHGGLIHPDR